MFKRKLTALDYHQIAQFDFNKPEDLGNLVVWLEDKKIRHLKIEDRAPLRNTSSPEWEKAFSQYLNELSCPFDLEDKPAVLDWLLGFAITAEYGDNVAKYKDITAESVKKSAQKPEVVSQNPLDNLDFNSQEFKDGVKSLAQTLQVTPHPDHLITLQAIAILVHERLSLEMLKNPSDLVTKGEPFPLEMVELGSGLNLQAGGDVVLNRAAKIMRLLFIHDLRDLQTKINEAIVAAQSITANPKTDTKLGKVGR